MSLQTWIAEFYSRDAHEVPAHEAISHSLTKWKGLTKENLSKHGLFKTGHEIYEDNTANRFSIDSNSCALCQHFDGNRCEKCPIAIEREGYSCDNRTTEDLRSPYHEFTVNSNPQPMIDVLQKIHDDEQGTQT